MQVAKLDLYSNGVLVFSGSVNQCADYIVKRAGGKLNSVYTLLHLLKDSEKVIKGYTVKFAGLIEKPKSDKLFRQERTRTAKFKYEPGCFNPKVDLKGKGVYSTPY